MSPRAAGGASHQPPWAGCSASCPAAGLQRGWGEGRRRGGGRQTWGRAGEGWWRAGQRGGRAGEVEWCGTLSGVGESMQHVPPLPPAACLPCRQAASPAHSMRTRVVAALHCEVVLLARGQGDLVEGPVYGIDAQQRWAIRRLQAAGGSGRGSQRWADSGSDSGSGSYDDVLRAGEWAGMHQEAVWAPPWSSAGQHPQCTHLHFLNGFPPKNQPTPSNRRPGKQAGWHRHHSQLASHTQRTHPHFLSGVAALEVHPVQHIPPPASGADGPAVAHRAATHCKAKGQRQGGRREGAQQG